MDVDMVIVDHNGCVLRGNTKAARMGGGGSDGKPGNHVG
ncbi:MAG: hypothetical protein ACJAZO_000352 [Myxococcota bacterium]